MTLWLVTASWSDDEAELTQQWEVNVRSEDEAVREVVMLLPSKPHHVEAKLLSETVAPDLCAGTGKKAVVTSSPSGSIVSLCSR